MGLYRCGYVWIMLSKLVSQPQREEFKKKRSTKEVYKSTMKELGIKSFEDANLKRLRMAMVNCDDATSLDFDSKNIDWDDYLINLYALGVLKKTLCK
ncbi:hypothetical protein HPP92_006541 [Vanilla planifolia]|uniref:Fatty acyl-CoA reductase C-terminal domain-containing protein n=1 Tax=Vanilla planifolia TaxID=51239 RepID=A0A835RP23_VANPL|nr:hypothetical protein HPP92_006541 [Vanilla planifolia]